MYKRGDKVETPLGIGKLSIVASGVMVNIKGHEVVFRMDEIEPYKSPHDKLLALGFTFLGKWTNGGEYDDYRYKIDNVWFLQIFHNINGLTYYTYDGRSDLELSRILTQYLEEL